MRKIEITHLDSALLDDIDSQTAGYELYEQPDGRNPGDWQILWHADTGRAGMVYVGNGCNGKTYWTDAVSPEDAYRRLQNEELSA